MYLLVIQKILRLSVDTLIVDDNDCMLNKDNLTQPIQVQLSQTQKTFSQFSLTILKSTLNFIHFGKKDDPHGWSISGNTGSQKYGYINA